jgi:hypothetical protein
MKKKKIHTVKCKKKSQSSKSRTNLSLYHSSSPCKNKKRNKSKKEEKNENKQKRRDEKREKGEEMKKTKTNHQRFSGIDVVHSFLTETNSIHVLPLLLLL